MMIERKSLIGFLNFLLNNNFKCEFNPVRKEVYVNKFLYRGRFSYVLSDPGCRSFVALPRAANLSPILG